MDRLITQYGVQMRHLYGPQKLRRLDAAAELLGLRTSLSENRVPLFRNMLGYFGANA